MAYVTTGTAASEVGVSPQTLTRWAGSGRVTPASRTPGGHYRWDLPALRAQLARDRATTAGTGPWPLLENIAAVCHDANRRWQLITGDPVPSPPWDDAPAWQAAAAIDGVRAVLEQGLTPQQSHAAWCARMRAGGWRYGPAKDPAAREHPLLLPWAELPAEARYRDELFCAIVRALRPR